MPFHALSSPFLAREIPGNSWIIQEMRLAIACLTYNILKPFKTLIMIPMPHFFHEPVCDWLLLDVVSMVKCLSARRLLPKAAGFMVICADHCGSRLFRQPREPRVRPNHCHKQLIHWTSKHTQVHLQPSRILWPCRA